MAIGTAKYPEQGLALGRSINVALGPATRSSVARLQEHTGLSEAELANCALTWYAYLDARLRAGYSLTLWNESTGKASTLSLTVGAPASDHGSRRLGGWKRYGSFVALGPAAQTRTHSLGLGQFQGQAVLTVRPWLVSVTSRGSPPIPRPPPGRGRGPSALVSEDHRSGRVTRATRNGGSS
jgi:hypothetical protein